MYFHAVATKPSCHQTRKLQKQAIPQIGSDKKYWFLFCVEEEFFLVIRRLFNLPKEQKEVA